MRQTYPQIAAATRTDPSRSQDPEASNSIQVSQWMTEIQAIGLSPAAFPNTLAGSSDGDRIDGTQMACEKATRLKIVA